MLEFIVGWGGGVDVVHRGVELCFGDKAMDSEVSSIVHAWLFKRMTEM